MLFGGCRNSILAEIFRKSAKFSVVGGAGWAEKGRKRGVFGG